MSGAITPTRLGKALMYVAAVRAARKALDPEEERAASAAPWPRDADFSDTQPATHELSSDDWARLTGDLELAAAQSR